MFARTLLRAQLIERKPFLSPIILASATNKRFGQLIKSVSSQSNYLHQCFKVSLGDW